MKKREPLFNAWQKIAYGVILLDLLIGSVGLAQADSAPVVRHLMTYPNWSRSVRGKDVRLHKIQAKNASGTVINVPATGVDVFTGSLSWDTVDPSTVPAFAPALPVSLHHKIALFYVHPMGWIVVPRDWHLWSADEGVDGGSFATFSAPTGWGGGWMYLELEPACEGCIWSATNGLIPAAFNTVGKYFQDLMPSVTQLDPVPGRLIHPNPCTTILHYQPEKSPSPIRAVVQLNISGDSWERNLYLALPIRKKALSNYILRRFRTEAPHPVCNTD